MRKFNGSVTCCSCSAITEYASCCRCNPPTSVTVTSLIYPVTQFTTTGPYVWESAELISSPVALTSGGSPIGCVHTKGSTVGGFWNTGQPIGAYDFLTENAWFSYVNGTQYSDNQVTGWSLGVFFSCNTNATTMQVNFGPSGAEETFSQTISTSPSIPDQRTLCETTSIVSGSPSNLQFYKKLEFSVTKDYNLCDWHGIYTGCDMSGASLSNGVRTLSGVNNGTQNGASSWSSGGMLGDFILVPNDAGSDWKFRYPNSPTNGSDRIGLYDGSNVHIADFEMNACEGNTTWTNVSNGNDVFTFTITGGRHCDDV